MLEQQGMLVHLLPEEALENYEKEIAAAIRADLKDPEFIGLCRKSGKVELWTTQMLKKGTNIWSAEFVRAFRVNRWLIYLLLVPVIAATTLLAIFFFAVFLALFAVAVVVVGLRVWWLRWKLRHSRSSESFEDRYVVTKEARIVGRETDKTQARVQRGQGTVLKLRARVAR